MNTLYHHNPALPSANTHGRYLPPTLLRLTYFITFLLLSLAPAIQSFGQNELEMASGSVSTTATTGPRTTIPEAATLLQNTSGTTFGSYSPPISVSVTLSNQSYTAVANAGGTGVTGNGIMFGANLNSAAKAATSVPIFGRMNSIGAPASTMFTSNPNGTAGTGIDVTANYAFDIFTTAEPLGTISAALNGRYYYGNVTINFNRPVNNPVLHFVGMGGTTASNNLTQGFATEFELATAGLAVSRLSGSTEFAVITSGTSYTVGNTAATITATSGAGASSGSIRVENTNVSSITFRVYLRGDGKGSTWSNANQFTGDRWMLGVSLRSPSTISGTVFDDANGGTIDGVATNAGGTLFANLVSGGSVIATTTIPASGTYAFSGLWEGTYSVVLSTTQGTIGSAPPAATLPTNWVNTGEGIGATPTTGDGTPNGVITVTVPGTGTTNDVPNVNFGIEQLPVPTSTTLASQVNPGGVNGVSVPPASFTGTDADGTVTQIHYTGFPTNVTSMTIGGTLYTSLTFPSQGVTVATGTAVRIDPTDGAVTAVIPFRVIDNAGQESTAGGTVSVPFTGLGVSGTVFDDGNGLTDNIVNGTGTNAGGLFTNLVDATGNVVASQALPTTGVYSFSNISAGVYSVRLSTTAGTVGSPAPAVSVPTGWTFTGEGTATAGDGTPNGSTQVTLTTTSVSGVNFGLDQLPVPTSLTISGQPNPGGTIGVVVPPASFTGTDADGTIASIRYTTFPTNTNSLTIGSTVYTSANFPQGGVTATVGTSVRIDPVDGAVTANIPFRLIDNAGQEGTAIGTIGVPFLVVTDFCNSQILFFNEDFGAGVGFGPPLSATTVPGYTYTNTDPINDGFYGIVNNPDQGDDFAFANQNVWLNGTDHTGNTNGRMLVINGSNPNQVAYTQPVSGLVVGRFYSLRTFIANIYNEAVLGTGEIKPNLILRVRDNASNILASVSTGDIASTSTLTWLPYSMSFTASTTSVKFELVSNAQAGNGNDFALDDIQFFEVIQPVLSTTAVTSACPATSASLAGVTASNQPASTTLTWHSSATATAGNRISDVTTLRSGTYYAAFFDGTCYTKTSPFVVLIVPCANPDAGLAISAGTSGTVVANVAANDFVNGQPATLGNAGNATIAQVGTYPTGVTLNTTTGSLSVAAGTAPGSYTVTYQLCDKLSPVNCTTAVATFSVTPTLSGTVFSDPNGLTDNAVNGTGTNAGGLFAILTDAASGTVVANAVVATTGAYSFSGITPRTYQVRLSTTSATVGSAAPAVSVPTGYTVTGEGTATAGDGTVDGITQVTLTATASVTGVNFGIEQLPTPTSSTLVAQANPGGINGVSIPPASFTGTDPDGTVASIRYTTFPTNVTSLTIGSTVYTSATFPQGGVTATVGTSVRIDPVDGAVTAVIPFRVIDNANVESTTTGTVAVPFVTLTLSGTVFDDGNGLTDNTVNGTGTNAGGLFAILTDAASGTVIANASVAGTGVYSFSALTPGNYNVRLSTTSATVGTTAPAASVPTGWVFTGEGIATAGDGTVNGQTAVSLTTANVTGVNFGIEQLPTPTSSTLVAQANPGGTIGVVVPPASFTGTDADGTIASIRYTTFPTNVTSLTIGSTVYTSATFPQGGVTATVGTSVRIDPVDGAVTAVIPFRVIDNAGQESTAGGNVSVPFTYIITATPDAGTVSSGTGGTAVANVAANDVVNGQPATLGAGGNATVATVGTYPPGITLNTTTGSVSVAQGTAPGSYTVTYQLCDKLSTPTCTTTTAVITVTPSVTATPDAGTVSSGTGGTAVANVAANDMVNGQPATLGTNGNATVAQVGTYPPGVTLNPATGSLSVAQGTAPGSYTVAYQLCDKLTPTTCSTAIVSFTVTPSVTATPDAGTVSSGTGGTAVANVAANDMVNGQPATLGAGGNATVATVGTYPSGITLNPATGSISVAQGTAPGSYTVAYQICDKLTPTTCATSVVSFTITPGVSGTVFDDSNGLTDNIVNGTGTNAGGLFAILVNATNTVVTSISVSPAGTYRFDNIAPGTYSVRLSTTSATAGTTPPAVSLPTGWTTTGEGTLAAGDGLVNGITSVTVGSAEVSGVNFGIEQLPTPTSSTLVAQANPGGINGVSIPPASFTGTDPDGTVASIRYTTFPTNVTSLTIGSTVYTSATFPQGGVTATVGTSVRIDPVDGNVTAVIPFRVIDNANVESTTTGTVAVPFTGLIVSGTVLNDGNGLTDNIVNGTGTNAGGGLYVNLVDATGNVAAVQLVPSTGVYSFSNVAIGVYSVRLSTTTTASGTAAPAVSVPTGWTFTGEGTATAGDGTPNGSTQVTLSTASVSGVNFGLDQLPTPTSTTLVARANPGGTNAITVPPSSLTGTDPDGTVASIRYVSFPTNVTTLFIGNTAYTAANFPVGGVTAASNVPVHIDPIDGVVTSVISFRVIDNAGKESLATATATIPFSCTVTICPPVSGRKIGAR